MNADGKPIMHKTNEVLNTVDVLAHITGQLILLFPLILLKNENKLIIPTMELVDKYTGP